MLKDIKSLYFINKLFAYVDERQKLKMLRYNKSLQKNMNININNYKHFKGRYVVYEPNGLAKEYNGFDDSLIYEGEYSNGQRNGKGKEYAYYYDGSLIYEGEFLKGKKNGKGKEYSNFGRAIEYDGEYLNGKRNGKGKSYKYGNLIFEGEFLNDKPIHGTKYYYDETYPVDNTNGIGKEYSFNREIIFEGEYLNGEKNGKGKENNEFGNLLFEGEYLNDKRNGRGKEYYNDGKLKFEGEYFDDKEWEGKGYDKSNNVVYELKNGKGYKKE